MARIVPTILLHFHHPWRSDGRGRAKQDARAEGNAGAIADPPISAALRWENALDVPTGTPSHIFRRAPCSYVRFHVLASQVHE